MYRREQFWIGGTWTAPTGSLHITVLNPHTEELTGVVPYGKPPDIDRAVAAANAAFHDGPWPRLDPAERAQVIDRLAEIYARRAAKMAELITAEMGSPITFSRSFQVPEPLKMLRYYADLARTLPREETREGAGGPVTVRREPAGVCALIVPWNVPQWVIMTKLAPALAAGCTAVVKPAPETPLDACLLAEMLDEAGLPPGVVNIVPAIAGTSEYLVGHPGVDKVAFSGSVAAGRRIAAICGGQLKRCSTELGGKSASIVCDDADLGKTIPGLVAAGLMNSGQACAAQTRILVPRHRQDEITSALAETIHDLQVGDPMDPATDVGPLVSRRQLERVERYIRCGIAEGADLVTGGLDRPQERGWYVTPTVFGNASNRMRIAREEIFGPVLTIIGYDSDDEAVQIAGDSDYGLAGSVWTADPARGTEIARKIRTGTFGINTYRPDIAAPFGGVKNSGFGRELGPEGLDAYTELKSITRLPGSPEAGRRNGRGWRRWASAGLGRHRRTSRSSRVTRHHGSTGVNRSHRRER